MPHVVNDNCHHLHLQRLNRDRDLVDNRGFAGFDDYPIVYNKSRRDHDHSNNRNQQPVQVPVVFLSLVVLPGLASPGFGSTCQFSTP
jgi:hypothetical protein